MAIDASSGNHQSRPAGPPPGATEPPSHVQNSKVYEVFEPAARPDNAPPQNANALPAGYGQNTAGGRPPKLDITDAVKTVRLEDFKNIHTYPCVRESLLTAIGTAFAVGGGRVLFGATVKKACNWAVGAFCFSGVGSYEFFLQKRRLERSSMQRAVEIMDRKKLEKEKERETRRKERRERKEEHDREVEARSRQSTWAGLWGSGGKKE